MVWIPQIYIKPKSMIFDTNAFKKSKLNFEKQRRI